MTDVWLTIVLLAVVSIGFRVVAPLVIGGRELPSRVRTALLDTGPALIAAMVVLLLWPAGDDVPMQHTLRVRVPENGRTTEDLHDGARAASGRPLLADATGDAAEGAQGVGGVGERHHAARIIVVPRAVLVRFFVGERSAAQVAQERHPIRFAQRARGHARAAA